MKLKTIKDESGKVLRLPVSKAEELIKTGKWTHTTKSKWKKYVYR